jgi:hypothetical protein
MIDTNETWRCLCVCPKQVKQAKEAIQTGEKKIWIGRTTPLLAVGTDSASAENKNMEVNGI